MNPYDPDPTDNPRNMTLDFRFVEIEHEIWALGAYLDTLEEQLKVLGEKENERYHLEMQKEDIDEADKSTAAFEHYDLVESVFPRLVLNPMLVALWALYESAVNELADYVQKSKHIGLALKDAPGKNTLDKAWKYYDQKLNIPLCTHAATFERLRLLLVLRNAIAHANSRLSAMKKGDPEKIKEWEQNKTGVVIQDGEWVTFSMDFLKASYAMIEASLAELIKRVRAIK